MQASRDYHIRRAFILSADDLQGIDTVLSKHFAHPTYTATCSDGISRAFENSEGLLKYENLPNAAIVALTIRCQGSNFGNSARIVLENKTLDNIWLNIEGPEDAVTEVDRAFGHRLEAMKPWYAFIVRGDLVILGSAVASAIFLALTLGVAIGWIHTTDPPLASKP